MIKPVKKPMNELTPEELSKLYSNFVYYRDKYCNGHAKMGAKEFYDKYGLSAYVN